jgi:RimJ/RimL family protein N-acetyltransferase
MVSSASPAFLQRGTDYVRRRGLRSAAAQVVRHAKDALWVDDSHVWYALDLGARDAPRHLPPGLHLVRASEGIVDALEHLDTIGPLAARERLRDGAELWMALTASSTPAFACWLFRDRTPVFAAASGSVRLPDGVAALEDSITAPAYRGLGLAPAVWTRVAASAAEAGFHTIITTIGIDNAASRKAVAKVGFRAFAIDEHRRRFGRRRVRIWTDGSELGDELAAYLPASRSSDPPPESLVAAPALRVVTD